jgi:hypothetical protein
MRRLQNIGSLKVASQELSKILAAVQREFDHIYKSSTSEIEAVIRETVATEVRTAVQNEALNTGVTIVTNNTTTSTSLLLELQNSLTSIQNNINLLAGEVALLPFHWVTTGKPGTEIGKDGDTAWGTQTEKKYERLGGRWREV